MDPTVDQLLKGLGIRSPADLLALELGPEAPQVSNSLAAARTSSAELAANPKYFAKSSSFNTGISREQYAALRPMVEAEAKTRMAELFLPPFRVKHEEELGRCVVSVSDGAADIRVGDPSTKTASGKTFGEATKELAKLAPERLCMTWKEFLARDRIGPDEDR